MGFISSEENFKPPLNYNIYITLSISTRREPYYIYENVLPQLEDCPAQSAYRNRTCTHPTNRAQRGEGSKTGSFSAFCLLSGRHNSGTGTGNNQPINQVLIKQQHLFNIYNSTYTLHHNLNLTHINFLIISKSSDFRKTGG